MDQDQQAAAIISRSWLATSVSSTVARLESAWRGSTARTVARHVVLCLADRPSGAATLAVAAIVALGARQLRAEVEPAAWILPAFVLAWSAGTLLLTMRGRRLPK